MTEIYRHLSIKQQDSISQQIENKFALIFTEGCFYLFISYFGLKLKCRDIW